MHICFVNTNVAWGGGERWTDQYSRLARDAGHEVSVLAHDRGELAARLADEPGMTLHTLPLGNLSFLNPRMHLRLTRLLRSMGADTVVMSLPRDLKAAGPAARRAGAERIVYRRGIDVPVKNTAMNRWLYGRVITRLICNTEATCRSVLEANPDLIPRERIRIVNNGFDVAEFDARPVHPLLRRTPGETIIGCAARLTPQKGIHLLLEAAAILMRRGHRFRVVLAGNGELEPELRARSEQLHLAKRTEFLGFVEDIKSFYAGIDILALPSLFEGFGYVLIEAGRCAKPAVAFDISSNPEVVLDGQTGLLADPGNPEDFAEKLQQFMLDPALAAGMGRAAFEHAQRYDTARTYAEFEKALG